MKYERLTEKGKAWIESNHDEVEVYNRLAELEDKIEQGKMIEIPTKEFVFHISKSKNGNYVVREISKYYYMSVYACADGIMNKWFSTREEAEKKLKELQNG